MRIRRAGVCGTDLHIFEGSHPFLEYPRVIGHELSGEIDETGAGCSIAVGQKVSLFPISLAALASPAGAAKRIAASASPCSASISTAEWRTTSACRRAMSPLPTASRSTRRRWSSFSLSAPTRFGAQTSQGRPHPRGRGRPDRHRLHDLRQAARRVGYRARHEGGPPRLLPRHARGGPHGRRGDRHAGSLSQLTGGDLFDIVIDASGKAAAMVAGFDYVAHGGLTCW